MILFKAFLLLHYVAYSIDEDSSNPVYAARERDLAIELWIQKDHLAGDKFLGTLPQSNIQNMAKLNKLFQLIKTLSIKLSVHNSTTIY